MLVIGHSFVRRLLTPSIAAGIRNVGLDYADFTIILHGVSGLKRDQFKKELLVSCVQPDLVFPKLGRMIFVMERTHLTKKIISRSTMFNIALPHS